MPRKYRWVVLRRCWRLLWGAAPGLTVASIVVLLLETLAGLGSLYLLKRLVDVASASDATAAAVQFSLLLAGLAAVFYVIVRAVSGWLAQLYAQQVADEVDDRINYTAARADLSFFESSRYHDLLARALMGGGSRPARIIGNLFQLGQNGLMLLAMSGLILTVHWLLLPVLALSLVPGLLVRLQSARRLHEWQVQRIQVERQTSYLRWLLTDNRNAKEIRAFTLGEFLSARFSALRHGLRHEKAMIGARRAAIELLVGACATVAFFVSLALLLRQAMDGTGSAGDIVLFLLIFQRGQGLLQTLKTNLGGLYEDSLYLRSLFEFLDVQPVIVDLPQAQPLLPARRGSYELRGVSFVYPGTTSMVLEQVDLCIAPGQVVALVGANGSGKTTLIKLLLRLYEPDDGTVLYDGQPLPSYTVESYRRSISVVFQDYVHYFVSAAENIRYGDIRLPADDPRIAEAARRTGAAAVIERLPEGAATRLGRVFDDGHELSQGQWQKIALARALVADSSLVVMDEPTSALDPGAEFDLFRDFREIIGNRAALVISHRLSTVRQADRIYVLDQGRIVEHGSHDELIAQRGKYCELFEKQAHYYR